MKLSVSNIGWAKSDDDIVLSYLMENGYSGIEIAPTVIIQDNPYDNVELMMEYYNYIKNKYGLDISSMQSIWYGQTGNIFVEEDRKKLSDYTKKAIDFAEAIKCKNLVFGCPKNRIIPDGHNEDEVVAFFKEIGDYAYEHNTVVALEANPKIYNTNFINTTSEAISFVKKVDSKGLLVNLDMGTVIENNEDLDDIEQIISLINHIHISEPYLIKIQERDIHKRLANILDQLKYSKYISIEMKNTENLEDIKESIIYVRKLFKNENQNEKKY